MGDKPDVRVRRVYDEPDPDDGTRVLVDRIWPRGLTKDKARLDQWLKQVAPSTELRRWYSHDPERFGEFGRRTCRHDQGLSRVGLRERWPGWRPNRSDQSG